MPRTMFITRPIWLFMNCSASQPATPPMMMAAIQPNCASFMADLLKYVFDDTKNRLPFELDHGAISFLTFLIGSQCSLWVISGHLHLQKLHVRFTPESDIKCDTGKCPLWAKSGHGVGNQSDG